MALLAFVAVIFATVAVLEISHGTSQQARVETVLGRAAGYDFIARSSSSDSERSTSSESGVVAVGVTSLNAVEDGRLLFLDIYEVSIPVVFGSIVEGRGLDSEGQVLVTERVADSLQVGIGSELDLGGQASTIVGIYVHPAEPEAVEAVQLGTPSIPSFFLVPANVANEVRQTKLLTPSDIRLSDGLLNDDDGRFFAGLSRSGPLVGMIGLLAVAGAAVAFGRARESDIEGLRAAGFARREALRIVRIAGAFAVLAGIALGYVVGALVVVFARLPISAMVDQRWVTVDLWPLRLGWMSILFVAGAFLVGRSDLWQPNAPTKAASSVARLPAWAGIVLVVVGLGLVVGSYPVPRPIRLLLSALGVGVLLVAFADVISRIRCAVHSRSVFRVIDRIDPLRYSSIRATLYMVLLASIAIGILPAATTSSSDGQVPPKSMVVRNLTEVDASWLSSWYSGQTGMNASVYLSPLDDFGPQVLRIYPGNRSDCLERQQGERLTDAEGVCFPSFEGLNVFEIATSATDVGERSAPDGVWLAKPELVYDGTITILVSDTSTGHVVSVASVPAREFPALGFDQLPGGIAPDGFAWPPTPSPVEGIVVLENFTGIEPQAKSALAFQLAGRLGYSLSSADQESAGSPRQIALTIASITLLVVIASSVSWLSTVWSGHGAVWALVGALPAPKKRLYTLGLEVVGPYITATTIMAVAGPIIVRDVFGYPVRQADWISLSIIPVGLIGALVLVLAVALISQRRLAVA